MQKYSFCQWKDDHPLKFIHKKDFELVRGDIKNHQIQFKGYSW